MEIENFDEEEAETLREMGYREDCLFTLEDYQNRPLRFLVIFSTYLCGEKLRLLLHGMIAEYFYMVREAVPTDMANHLERMMNVIEEGDGYKRGDWVWAKKMIRNWTQLKKEARWRREDKAMYPTVVVGRGPDPEVERRVQKICLTIISLYVRSSKGALDCGQSAAKRIDAWDNVEEIVHRIREVARELAVDEVVEAGGGLNDIGDVREESFEEFNREIFEKALNIIFEED
jgi:hypothetical protein